MVKLTSRLPPISRCRGICHRTYVSDEHLSWHKHIQVTSSKISKTNRILNKLHRFLPTPIILQLYNSLMLPYLTYCNCVWGTGSENKFKSLITCQKRAVKYIAKVSAKTHSLPYFKKYNILKLNAPS